jgi:hypothetical protein
MVIKAILPKDMDSLNHTVKPRLLIQTSLHHLNNSNSSNHPNSHLQEVQVVNIKVNRIIKESSEWF